jgi:DNA-binding NarL/FixJ family response regulator
MDANGSKTVLLVGHCGPDGTYMRMAVKSAVPGVTVTMAEDPASMEAAIQRGVDLILFNRELGYGFEPDSGVEMIRALKAKHPDTRMMLVSNYPDAQAAALSAGALNGFGKREIGSPKAKQLLQSALSGNGTDAARGANDASRASAVEKKV